MTNKTVLIAAGLCGLLLGLSVFFFSGEEEPPAPAPEPLPITELVPPPPVQLQEPRTEPDIVLPEEPIVTTEPEAPAVVVEEPVVPAQPEPEPETLPDLNNSDAFVMEKIADFRNSNAILNQLASMQIIRKFVVLVDGLSRGGVPDRDLPVTRAPVDMDVTRINEEFYRLEPASYERFTPLVNTFAALDSQQLLTLYRLMKPLFDNAYAELGYPDRTFSNTLQQAMTNIQDVQLPLGEILLTRPSVNYHFADPVLESRTDLEKLFIRMGPENTAKVQSKVRELRTLLGRTDAR